LNVKEVKVDRIKCKSCGICIDLCPKKVLKENETGDVYVENISGCIGCMICENECPDFAIKVYKEGKVDEKNS
jgi:2-oxoglutarate ferredoxin oxidoreductase subunit delta